MFNDCLSCDAGFDIVAIEGTNYKLQGVIWNFFYRFFPFSLRRSIFHFNRYVDAFENAQNLF